MPELFLIRHAQASFGADDYDQLSDLGVRQAQWLGEGLVEMGVKPARLVAGALRRQQDTATAMAAAMGLDLGVETVSGLEEYDSDAVLAAYAEATGAPPTSRTDRRAHFRALRDALAAWTEGRLDDRLEERWPMFVERVEHARGALADPTRGAPVVAISSGGVIARIVAETVGSPAAAMIALNLQAKNTGVSRFIFTDRAFYLSSFNAAPHLERLDRADALTYA